MSEAAAESRIDPHVWRIASVVVLGTIMSILDTTIVNVALHTLQKDLDATLSQIQWVLTGYMLALAAVIPVTGWAARRFGQKNVYILSLVLFTLGSVLCGLATSTTELIVFRILQGFGGGMLLPIGQMMLAGAAGPSRMGRVMSVVAVPMMLAPIFGPTIGGADRRQHELALDLLRERADRDRSGDRFAAGYPARPWPGEGAPRRQRLPPDDCRYPSAHVRHRRGRRHGQAR